MTSPDGEPMERCCTYAGCRCRYAPSRRGAGHDHARAGCAPTATREPGLRAVLAGERHPQFASGSSEQVFAIEIDWPQGQPGDRFEAIWVKRSREIAERVVAALNALDDGASATARLGAGIPDGEGQDTLSSRPR